MEIYIRKRITPMLEIEIVRCIKVELNTDN